MSGAERVHWKYWAIAATAAWTLWGIGVKIALKRVDWMRLEVLSGVAVLLIMGVIAPSAFRLKLVPNDAVGFVAGGLGVAGAILFYIALSKGPVSVVIPLTSLYVVGVAAAGVLFFGEALTWRKVLGVALAAVAVILLATEE